MNETYFIDTDAHNHYVLFQSKLDSIGRSTRRAVASSASWKSLIAALRLFTSAQAQLSESASIKWQSESPRSEGREYIEARGRMMFPR